MLRLGIFTLILMSSIGQVLGLDYGSCEPNLTSKRYIQNDFSAPYPKEVIFSCEYHCFDGSKLHNVTGISKVNVIDISHDARAVVCAGVKVKQTSWGWDFDRVDPFYVYTSNISELRNWANKNISRENPQELRLVEELKPVFMEVGLTYIQVGKPGFEQFRDAGLLIYSIAVELPESTKTLDAEIKKILARGRNNQPPVDTADGLIHGFISSQAYFRFP